MAQYTVGRTWKDADFRISFGKMRSHPVEMALPDASATSSGSARAATSSSSPERQAHRETAVMMLLDDFPPHFALLDAYDAAADGLVGRDGLPAAEVAAAALRRRRRAGRRPGRRRATWASRDPRQSRILRAACHWFGDPAGTHRGRRRGRAAGAAGAGPTTTSCRRC